MKEPTQAEKQQFYTEMQPRWKQITTMLAADRPPDWKGYRFKARIECGADVREIHSQMRVLRPGEQPAAGWRPAGDCR